MGWTVSIYSLRRVLILGEIGTTRILFPFPVRQIAVYDLRRSRSPIFALTNSRQRAAVSYISFIKQKSRYPFAFNRFGCSIRVFKAGIERNSTTLPGIFRMEMLLISTWVWIFAGSSIPAYFVKERIAINRRFIVAGEQFLELESHSRNPVILE